MKRTQFSKEKIEEFVKNSVTIADVCRKCGWQPRGDNYKVIKRYISQYNLDTSHFTGQQVNIGNRLNKHNEKKAIDYLTSKSYVRTSTLKNKLYKEGLKEEKCECCGLAEWNGKPIPLQLHHINGNNTDNRFENLQILCPNCHAQTDNFCGKNHHNKKEIKYCEKCGVELKTKNGKLCSKCSNIENHLLLRKVERPCKNDLFEMIKNETFESIARKFNVCSNTIKKWCKAYNLPSRKCDLKIIYEKNTV